MNFSVLLSVYRKENPEYLKQSIDSIFTQTVPPTEIVMVEDGPLTDELYKVLDGRAAAGECGAWEGAERRA